MPAGLPPGPRDWTFGLTQLMRTRRDLFGYNAELQKRYGDTVCIRYGPYTTYAFFHPDAIREVLVSKAKQLRRFPRPMNVLAQWNGNSLLIAEGDEWLRQRRMVQPAFQPRRFERYAACMVERTGNFLNRWLTTIDRAGSLEINVDRAMTDLTLEIISKTMFDADVSADASDIGRAVAILSEVAVSEMQSPASLPDWLPLASKRRKKWAIERLDETVRRFIRERRASGEDRGDLLSMLLLAEDEEAGGGRLTDEQARNESMTLLIAGHDTTAAGLTWALYCLAKNPASAAQVQQEIDAVLGSREPTAADVAKLEYTQRAIKEALRIYPPAIGVFMRQTTAEVEIGGYLVPKNTLVQVLSYFPHHDPRWFPEPEKFDPDRFLPERQEKLPQFAYFPFGGGPRVCVGAAFATMEMTLVVATLLQNLNVEVAAGQGEAKPMPLMSLRPKGGILLKWTRRSASRSNKAAQGGTPHVVGHSA